MLDLFEPQTCLRQAGGTRGAFSYVDSWFPGKTLQPVNVRQSKIQHQKLNPLG